jgi:hypothetical protein
MVPIDFGEGRATTTFPGPYKKTAGLLGLAEPPIHVSRRGLIDAYMDILNPVQHTAKDMELARLKAEFGDRLCFQGGVDQQRVLTQGKREGTGLHCCDSIKRHIKRGRGSAIFQLYA